MSDFIQGVKSTIDRYGVNIAAAYSASMRVVDVTDHVNVEDLLSSDEDLLLWEMGTLDEAPRKPFWNVSFAIGVKTVTDPSRYTQMDILKAVSDVIQVDETMPVHDYTGAVAGPQLGYLYITSAGVGSHQSDRMMGLRMIVVNAKGFSYP